MDDMVDLKQHCMSRRMLLKVVGASIGTITLGNALPSFPTQAAPSSFIKGADISWLPQMEAHGYKFYNASGVQEDLLTLLKGYGINAMKLRTWVNPSNDPVNGHCSQAETVAMAVRCAKANFAVGISFHFGDTWNDEGHQNPPSAWKNMSYAQMLYTIRYYVHNFMMDLIKAHVTPHWIAIGNEINEGICLPTGSLAHYPDQMTGLLKVAYEMVKQVSPSTQVLIHLASPHKTAAIQNFFDKYKANGGQWDISAFSSYLSGNDIPGALSAMATFRSMYHKPVMQIEFGGRMDNPQETQSSLETYIKGNKSLGSLGLFYWEPEGYWPFTDYGMGAWDPKTMRPTTALTGFLNV